MTTGCPVHADFDPLAEPYLADPLAQRTAEPIFYAPGIDYYVVTRHADIAEVFRDTDTYSAASAQLPLADLVPEARQILLDGGHRPQPSMVSLDGADHDRLRRPATRVFTMKRSTAWPRRSGPGLTNCSTTSATRSTSSASSAARCRPT